jgi:c-di-GMP-binding flagellar brake protein YcgR
MERLQKLLATDQPLDIKSSSRNERRKHPRYKMNENVLSISEGVLAEVEDISVSGISFRYQTSADDQLRKAYDILLLNCQLGTSVEGLSGRLIRSGDKTISSTLPSKMIMHCSLEFHDLNQMKRQQLGKFIKDGVQR